MAEQIFGQLASDIPSVMTTFSFDILWFLFQPYCIVVYSSSKKEQTNKEENYDATL